MNTVIQIAYADFLERVRRSNFLLTVFITIILAYVFCPPRNGGYVTLIFGENYVGLFNSAWMGTSVAISISIFFSLIGFYVVSNALQVDLETKVGEMIAASPLHKTKYLLAKFLSNLAILNVIVLITMLTAIAMQLIRGEDYHVHLWAYFAPFVFMLLPGMAVIAAIAVLFEGIPLLRGTIGNILYFVVWGFIIFSSFKPISLTSLITISDLFGQGIAITDIVATLQEKFPKYSGLFSNGLTTIDQKADVFIWQGVHWNFSLIMGRFLWILFAVILVLITSLFFHRFQQGQILNNKRKKDNLDKNKVDASTSTVSFSIIRLTPVKKQFSNLSILFAELKLMLQGLRWWYLVALGLVVLSFILPFAFVKTVVWPVLWLWPLSIWSAMGTREKKYKTEELIYSSPNIMTKLFPSTWFSGVVITGFISSGIAVRCILEGDMTGLFVWLVGTFFIPTLALTCGVITGNSKLFEVIYLSIWYMGPLNQLPIFNFLNTKVSITALVYLIITIFLLLISLFLKKRKLNS
ncbi:hypothetical protein SAMN05444392_102353 [Seinonella peptonophila]|uniref:ABC-2 family transporter protein n=1 Tax=Seinonella peptonophila TaxID=112248 RepID=A0A1M4VGI5_9BACL|nr:hypothetical protein [Seinonella peptonophila]SHE68081.1 hypothetical protein SAMN05444392_102353 [Seinonella peptonophila]